MAKRLTATDKWDDPWFFKLSKDDKLFWIYVCDKCSHAGIWQVNWEVVKTYIKGYRFNAEVFQGRIMEIAPEKWFIKKFVGFQYGTLNPSNRAHASVLIALEKEGASKGLASPMLGPKDKDKEKEKDKDKDKKGMQGETQSLALAPAIPKPYLLPDPKTDPKKCLVLSYKSRKGVPYDNRDWDIANFGRAMKASGVLLGICGDLAVAQTCLDALAADYDSKDLSWTIETVARNAADWLKKTGRLDANASRAGLRLAIAERRSKERREEGLVKASEGSVLTPLGDGPPSQSGS